MFYYRKLFSSKWFHCVPTVCTWRTESHWTYKCFWHFPSPHNPATALSSFYQQNNILISLVAQIDRSILQSAALLVHVVKDGESWIIPYALYYLTLSNVFFLPCVFSSISSTLMDLESTASSGRSTPAMLNGHGGGVVAGSGSAPAGGKSLSYTCCWDHCQLLFPSSPDLAEHIRATHVDGQRGGVSVSLSGYCVCVCLCVCARSSGCVHVVIFILWSPVASNKWNRAPEDAGVGHCRK